MARPYYYRASILLHSTDNFHTRETTSWTSILRQKRWIRGVQGQRSSINGCRGARQQKAEVPGFVFRGTPTAKHSTNATIAAIVTRHGCVKRTSSVRSQSNLNRRSRHLDRSLPPRYVESYFASRCEVSVSELGPTNIEHRWELPSRFQLKNEMPRRMSDKH